MRPLVCLFILAAVGYNTAFVIEEDKVTFERQNGNLTWPLPDVDDPGVLLVHGAHCFEMIQKPKDKDSDMGRMHNQHCRMVVSHILHLFETNPTYRVDDWICKSLQLSPFLFDYSENDKFKFDYPENDKLRFDYPRNDKFKFDYPKNDKFKFDYPKNDKFKFDYRENDKLRFDYPKNDKFKFDYPATSFAIDQDVILCKLQAKNFGDLLMKNWTDPQALNEAEKVYLAKYDSQHAITIGAVGVYCRVKGHVQAIRDAMVDAQ